MIGKGKLRRASDRTLVADVEYAFDVRHNPRSGLKSLTCRAINFIEEYEGLDGPDFLASPEVILELEDGREVSMVAQLHLTARRVGGGLRGRTRYTYTVLQIPQDL